MYGVLVLECVNEQGERVCETRELPNPWMDFTPIECHVFLEDSIASVSRKKLIVKQVYQRSAR